MEKSLKSFVDLIFEQSYLRSKGKKFLLEDQLNVSSDEDALKHGDVDSKIIIDKLNTIRSGKSFKDSIVNSQMEKYLKGLSKDEKTALFAFTKAIAQIVTGEVSADNAIDPSEPPADLNIKKSDSPDSSSKVTLKVSSVGQKDDKKVSKEEDTTGPTPIKAK